VPAVGRRTRFGRWPTEFSLSVPAARAFAGAGERQAGGAEGVTGRRRAPGAGGLVGRYLLRLLLRPLLATLLVVLPALLMERLLRLFDLLAGVGGPVSSIARLLVYLVPHYLGLALPAALFVGVSVVVARLSEDREMDALQSVGFSLGRLSRPFLLVGLLFAVGGVGLYGYVQPLGRYAYRAAFHSLANAGWNGTVVPGEFTRVGDRVVVYADSRDPADGSLRGVFLQQRRAEDGAEVLTTAASGRLLLAPERGELFLELERGRQITLLADGRVSTLEFAGSDLSRPLTVRLPGFRPRGSDERELTLWELWAARHGADPPPMRPSRLDGELHGRLVRAASLAVLPLLAVPMGLAAKRARRSHGIALAAVILMLYQQGLQLLESLGDVGRLDARPVLWAAFALFAAFCGTVFRRSSRNPTEGGFDGALAMIERGAGVVAALLPRRWRRASP
jgi:lipopolysaccharide export system permease protein